MLTSLRKIWYSEESPLARRTKQFIAVLLPRPVLIAIKKRYYLRLLRSTQVPREDDMKALEHLLRLGDFALDVGAFVGFYAQRLAQLVGPAGEVWSFEPVPETFAVLSYAVKCLPLSNVRVFPYALSDADGPAHMEIPHYHGGGETLYDARITPDGSARNLRTVEIQRRTLDSLLAELPPRPLSFMKVDVEFHELHTIRGALATIRRDHPALLIEVLRSPEEPGEQRDLMTLLVQEGYSPFRFDGKKFFPRAVGDKSQNLFFLTATHLQKVPL